MKKQQTLRLTTMAAITAAASEWLHRENRICSAIMEEPVTNLQLLHIYHVAVPALLALCCDHLGCTIALLNYSVVAFIHGMRYIFNIKKGGRA